MVKVTRKVDTVNIEIDANLAEKLLEVMSHVRDDTVHPIYRDWDKLKYALVEDADINDPSPLYRVEGYGHPDNHVLSIRWRN